MNSDILTLISPDGLGEGAKSKIIGLYVEQLSKACIDCRIRLPEAAYSEKELRRALDEVDIDIRALFTRRSTGDGISRSKIAGVMAFRLSRFKIVHLSGPALENDYIYMIQDMVGLSVVVSLILRAEISDRHLRELIYQMSRRHANQETLGLVFDMMLLDAT